MRDKEEEKRVKKVLFIAPKFYDFELHIHKAIENLGYEVDFYNEKPELTLFFRLMQKMPKSMFENYLDRYYMSIINSKRVYDVVFIIRAELIKPKYLKLLKERHSKAKFVMYQWDFYDNLPYIESQIKYFDRVYSFDKNDAEHFGLILKPLFFTEVHRQKAKERPSVKYKLSFIGSHHSDRFEFINYFMKINKLNKEEFFYHLFRPKLSYVYNKYFSKNNIVTLKYRDVESNMLSEKETLHILNSSNVILDIHHVKQNGLTIRSIEALGLKKKLITTNPLIKEYDFYNENNIYFISREEPIVSKEFFEREYEEIDEKVYNSYSVSEWVKEFFESEEVE